MASWLLAGPLALPRVATASGINFLKAGLVKEADVQAMLASELEVSGLRAGPHVQRTLHQLETMYRALPKNGHDRLDHQAVRYALHRFFVHQAGWFIRGLEPNNDTWHGAPDPAAHNSSALKEWVPSYLQDLLEQRLGAGGSDLFQLAALAASLEDMIQKEAHGRLEATFEMHEYSKDRRLTEGEAADVIETFYVGFLVAGDFVVRSVADLVYKKQEFENEYVGWKEAYYWLLDVCKEHLKKSGSQGFTFQDIEQLVSKIGQDYYKFNDKECTDLKEGMRKMQGKKPGRVRLSTFYHMGMYTHWHFTEKVDYLKALGALDDSDPNQPFVIIANYAMARPNCLDSSNLYTICCRNECEDLLGHLESLIGTSTAAPDRIAELVAALASPTVAAPRTLDPTLLAKLHGVASQHGGEVPMHGRLFAQWMHHAYPLECPYPHELGAVNPQTPDEWMKETGHASEQMSTEEMHEVMARDSCAVGPDGRPGCDDETAELPWTENEELLTWHPRDSTNDQALSSALGGFSVAVEAVLAALGFALAFAAGRRQVAGAGDDDNGKGKRRFKGMTTPLGVLLLCAVAACAGGLLDSRLFACVVLCSGVVLLAHGALSSQRGQQKPKEYEV